MRSRALKWCDFARIEHYRTQSGFFGKEASGLWRGRTLPLAWPPEGSPLQGESDVPMTDKGGKKKKIDLLKKGEVTMSEWRISALEESDLPAFLEAQARAFTRKSSGLSGENPGAGIYPVYRCRSHFQHGGCDRSLSDEGNSASISLFWRIIPSFECDRCRHYSFRFTILKKGTLPDDLPVP